MLNNIWVVGFKGMHDNHWACWDKHVNWPSLIKLRNQVNKGSTKHLIRRKWHQLHIACIKIVITTLWIAPTFVLFSRTPTCISCHGCQYHHCHVILYMVFYHLLYALKSLLLSIIYFLNILNVNSSIELFQCAYYYKEM